MKSEDYLALTSRQQLTMLVAMHVRNSMEEFHGEHLDDKQMKELNQIIRQAIFDALGLVDLKSNSFDEVSEAGKWLAQRVPDYWEVPDKPSGDLGIN